MTTHAGTTTDLLNPVWAALTGPHKRFSESYGAASAYRSAVSPFAALDAPSDPHAWSDLAELSGGRIIAIFNAPPAEVANRWEPMAHFDVLQMVHHHDTPPESHVPAPLLTGDDVNDMLRLVDETEPGPFFPETIKLGRYFGIRAPSGELTAMGGQRFDTGTWQEISAICTLPTHRGQGHATRILRSVLADIAGRGRGAFLHVEMSNPATSLYRQLGFRVHQRHAIHVLRPVP